MLTNKGEKRRYDAIKRVNKLVSFKPVLRRRPLNRIRARDLVDSQNAYKATGISPLPEQGRGGKHFNDSAIHNYLRRY